MRATGSFLESMSDNLRSLGSAKAFLWSLETGLTYGVHVHILIHVHPTLARKVSRFQRRWLGTAGATFKKGIILSRPVGARLSLCLPGRDENRSYEHNLAVAVEYVLKNVNQAARAAFPNRFKECSGLIYGKRCGTSQNIGRSARAGRVGTGGRHG